jgi:hypothetical protein
MDGMLSVVSYGIGTILGIVLIGGLIVLIIHDVTQKKHTVLRNFPVIGRLRFFFESLGEYFRQYFFAGDRSEMPFNRATRSFIYRLAKGEGSVIGFGSTNDLREPGSIIFVNHPFPVLEEDRLPTPSLMIGEGYCRFPLEGRSIVNVSGMSFGAISAPAVRALSRGARLHVLPRLYPGVALPHQHLSHRRHHPQQAPAARAGGGGEVPAGGELCPQHEPGNRHDRALLRLPSRAGAQARARPHRADREPERRAQHALSVPSRGLARGLQEGDSGGKRRGLGQPESSFPGFPFRGKRRAGIPESESRIGRVHVRCSIQ